MSYSAKENMERDYAQLLALTLDSKASLHFHTWEKEAVTYGYFAKVEQWINLQALEKLEWEAARRPTGGGVIFHKYDLSFAAYIPINHKGFSTNTLQNYAYINSKVANAIYNVTGITSEYLPSSSKKESSFCMAQPTPYDLMVEGQKVAGAAQRRTKIGYLHQGSICLKVPSQSILNKLLLDKAIAEAISANSFALADQCNIDESELRKRLQDEIIKAFLEN